MSKQKKESKEVLKTVDIKGRPYVTVPERIRYFNEAYPNGSIVTNIVSLENGVVLMQARVTPDVKQPERYCTAYAQEKEGATFINKTSYIENCETSAVGRALGMMGIGVEESLASAEEVANAVKQQENPPLSRPKPKKPVQKTTETPQNEAKPAQNGTKPTKAGSIETKMPDSVIQRFKEQKERLGEEAYFQVLKNWGYTSAVEIKSPDQRIGVLNAMEGLKDGD